ncbi:D-ribose pyranase [Clostridium estertheticum]|uniref:D-ribose pyranase n=1 Tax=Clostridium estertheticum TaxID=238834 RepID=UPI001C6DFB93|nr:D-ribose pyranase [Clostridium estertheticum]MBW9170340.1 D-ribose pyranase [Clostridium estertheticum]MBX4268009.1 D-ribose pyranase [Clostridium estertheticum]WLC75190.1 D-ribose pyranase [Clostridium estertheticum]WLC80052.1 D-ribose pyranase [Clostridium estertheticum]
MKKIGILNGEISSVVSKMGHKDLIAIGDCGLPIPDKTKRIDIALSKGIPSFIKTLKNVLLELQVEEVILALEIKENNPKVLEEIKKQFKNVKFTFITHEELKIMLNECKAVIRTGEQTPYANIILKSGVIF